MLSVEGKIMKPEQLQNKIFTNGTLIGNEEVQLHSETSGKVTAISFEEGRRVRRGDLLLKINDAELQATLKKNLIKEELAKDKEFRAKQMLEKNLTSQQEYDVALNELNSVRADIEFTNAQIAKTEIHAPFDGIIGLRSVSIGSYISPQTQVATLQSINPIKIDFSIPQKYYNEVKDGRVIEFKLPNTDKLFKGKVYAVELNTFFGSANCYNRNKNRRKYSNCCRHFSGRYSYCFRHNSAASEFPGKIKYGEIITPPLPSPY